MKKSQKNKSEKAKSNSVVRRLTIGPTGQSCKPARDSTVPIFEVGVEDVSEVIGWWFWLVVRVETYTRNLLIAV